LICGGRGSNGPTGGRATRRPPPSVGLRLLPLAALLAVVALFPPEILGISVPKASQSEAFPQDRSEVRLGDPHDPCVDDFADVLREVRVWTDKGQPDSAAVLLEGALQGCPDHPELLVDLTGVRVLQGDLVEAESLATRLVQIRPGSNHAWELLALTRYLQDDTHGALRAWGHAGRPLVRELDVRVLGPDGPRGFGAGPDPNQVTGVTAGRRLTVEALVRGERRLGDLPAAERARLGYRMLPGGEAAVDGTVVVGTDNPFTRPELVVHALRLVGRRVHLVSADPLGRLERWELSGTMEGTLHEARFALAHSAPGSEGIWRWELDHHTGRYGPAGLAEASRERSTSLAWSHTDWVTATLRGALHGQVDVRPERGTFVGAGTAWSLLPRTERGALGAEVTGWTRVGGGSAASSATGSGLESDTRFGRAELRGMFHALRSRGGESRTGGAGPGTGRTGIGVGLDLRGGIVAVSQGIPPDLMPRIGSGGNTAILMRGRSDLDDQGVIRPLFPGTAWAHGGIEVVQPVGAVGPVGFGLALFADGVRVLAPEGRRPDVAAGRRGAVHLGGGLRARIPWVDGWLRTDWGIDPHDGTSTFSAAWVREHRLHRLSAH
jgi:hypothetical protein